MSEVQYEIGKVYDINHSRKGKFKMLIESQDNTWLDGIIIEGTADAILYNNIKYEGDKITIRKKLLQ